jgi:nitroreductase
MEILEALFSRRSIRKYTQDQVTDEMLKNIIKAGMYAPSAVNKQPWHFIIFRNKDTIRDILEVHPNALMLKSASAGILVCFDLELQHDDGYGPVDCSAATQNILLAAHGSGLGACWVGIYPRTNRIQAISKIFELPEHVIPFSVISVGFPDEARDMPERFIPNRIHFNKW